MKFEKAVVLRISKEIDIELASIRKLLDEYGDLPEFESSSIECRVKGSILHDRLSVLLRFRHVFRNMYGFALDADKLHETAEDFAAVAESSIAQIERFLAWLASEAR